jgi:protein subunit release factor A
MAEEIHLSRKDFIVQWFSGQGAGGQHRNKHQNCCRIVHPETGLSGVGQTSRERSANQRTAFLILASRIIEYYKEDPERRTSSETIRTYHEPRNTVKDHVSEERDTYKNVVVGGDLSAMIDARRKAMQMEGLDL